MESSDLINIVIPVVLFSVLSIITVSFLGEVKCDFIESTYQNTNFYKMHKQVAFKDAVKVCIDLRSQLYIVAMLLPLIGLLLGLGKYKLNTIVKKNDSNDKSIIDG